MTVASTASQRLRRVAAPLSPGRRRWIRFLHGLPLDPDKLAGPLAAPSANDFIICGSPRTGTTLLCAALFQPPSSVVTVMEPWDGMRFPPADLFASLRAEIDTTGFLRRGRLDVAALLREGAARWCRDGEVKTLIDAQRGYSLGVKWPAYWRYLDVLPDTKFIVCLRDPLEVIASYKKTGGRVGIGLEYDTAFNRTLNDALRATRDPHLRRIELFDYIHDRILPCLSRPNVMTVHYERWFQDPERLLAEIGAFLGRNVADVPVKLRAPATRSGLTASETAVVRERCRTARALGYNLDRTSSPPEEGSRS